MLTKPTPAQTKRATRLFIATLTPTLARLNAVCVDIETRGGYSKTEMLAAVRAFRRGDESHPIAAQIYAALRGANLQ